MEDWISRAVIYQVNLRAWAFREPRNPVEAARERPVAPSPLAYLERHLTTIRRLGATVVYLMPPYPIGLQNRKGIGSPYAIRDFCAVDPEYGTLEELAAVARRAHAVGLRLILDITPNHTSADHVWTRTYPEYYVRTPDGRLYYDADWSDTAKLDYRQPALRRAMVEVFKFWLGFLGSGEGVDGFRLDMAHLINDRGFWNDALAELRRHCAPRRLLFLAECYGTANNLDLFARGIDAAYDDDFYKVCQYLYAVDETGESAIALAPEAEGHGDFADKLAAFRAGGIAGAMAQALLNYETLPAGAGGGPWLARYTDNHDEGRGLYRFGPGAVRAVNRLLFLSGRCLPFLLTGQEFGALNRPPIHDRLRPCEKGRRRLTAGGADFTPGVECEANVWARGRDARRAWYAFYRELIELRRRQRALREGAFRLLEAGEEAPEAQRTVLAFERRLGAETLACAVNLGPQPRRLTRERLFAGQPLYGGLSDGWLDAFGATVTRNVTHGVS